MEKELKFDGGVPSGKLKAPPKSCIPNRAKISMNKKSRKSSEMMERIELSNDMTKFRKDDQYLVTLKIRSNLRARRTDKPNEPAISTMFV